MDGVAALEKQQGQPALGDLELPHRAEDNEMVARFGD